ncbi:MAG: TlyA family RNA methyltransferase [Candidatus Saganbacteria bacterium]|nr:TlyA family RNA methyltransferase [Candidatus Saganbacteria bacterium]
MKKKGPLPFVSRGGLKLDHALQEFQITVAGRIAIDIGAATGGFTDCLLQRGAAKVYTVDVSYGQLAWKLRQDPRVKVIERKNIRFLTLKDLGLTTSDIGLGVIDVSFISLTRVLPVVYNLLAEQAEVVALIKPQFEARREQVPRGGVIRDQAVRDETIAKIQAAAAGTGLKLGGLTQSPIKGADGNVEYLIRLIK